MKYSWLKKEAFQQNTLQNSKFHHIHDKSTSQENPKTEAIFRVSTGWRRLLAYLGEKKKLEILGKYW